MTEPTETTTRYYVGPFDAVDLVVGGQLHVVGYGEAVTVPAGVELVDENWSDEPPDDERFHRLAAERLAEREFPGRGHAMDGFEAPADGTLSELVAGDGSGEALEPIDEEDED